MAAASDAILGGRRSRQPSGNHVPHTPGVSGRNGRVPHYDRAQATIR